MRTKSTKPDMNELIGTLGVALTPESAKRILKMKASARLQARVNALARRNSDGTISEAEKEEYHETVRFGTYLSILQSKARLLLANSAPEA